MAMLSTLLQEKADRRLVTASPGETVLDATRRMNAHGIGSLLVLQDGAMVGIFTERDVLRRVVAAERQPADVSVGEVMTTDVVCCSPETTIDEARSILKHRRIRHLPVLSAEGDVLGVISIGDLNAHYASSQESQIFYLHEYLHGRT